MTMTVAVKSNSKLEALGLTERELEAVLAGTDGVLLEEIARVLGGQNPDAGLNAKWLRAKHPLLLVSPLHLLKSGKGVHVLNALMRAEYGEFS